MARCGSLPQSDTTNLLNKIPFSESSRLVLVLLLLYGNGSLPTPLVLPLI